MYTRSNAPGLSPLDQIRLVESEIERQLVAARETAEADIAKVRTRAEQVRQEERETGRKEGEAQYKNTIAAAEEEAKTIVSRAFQQAKEIRLRCSQRQEQVILMTMRIVTGQEGTAHPDEH